MPSRSYKHPSPLRLHCQSLLLLIAKHVGPVVRSDSPVINIEHSKTRHAHGVWADRYEG